MFIKDVLLCENWNTAYPRRDTVLTGYYTGFCDLNFCRHLSVILCTEICFYVAEEQMRTEQTAI